MKAILLTTLVLAACGGGEPVTPPESRRVPTPVCKAQVTVQLYGDSTQVQAFTYGYLQGELDTRFGTGRVQLGNRAVGGTDSLELFIGGDGLNPPWPTGLTADIAIVNHGINDDVKGRTLESYAQRMLAFAQGNGHTRMIIETPNPLAPYRGFTPTAAWAQAGRDAAVEAGVPVADVQAYVLGLPDWEAWLVDGVHPTAELQQAIARDVTAPALGDLVDGLLCGRT